MPRHLLILRHAKSAWDSDAADDFARPLAKRGRRNAALIGHWLKQQRLKPDLVISSPAERAKQTLMRINKEWNIDEKHIHWDRDMYLASRAELLDRLNKSIKYQWGTLLLVGHNPGLEELLTFLCGDDLPLSDKGKLLTTAAIALVEVPDTPEKLSKGAGKLLRIIRPRELKPSELQGHQQGL